MKIPPLSIPAFTLLISRTLIFLFFQALIAIFLQSWQASEKYWLLTATLTNLISIVLLYKLFKKDGKSYFDLFAFKKSGIKKDILWFLLLTAAAAPIILLPGNLLSNWLWIDSETPTKLMFRPIEDWLAWVLLIAFPITIAFAELATYFGYIMPKLRKYVKSRYLAVLLPVLFLSLQHCALPFIPDLKFILYRALMFLPFAALLGFAIYRRPSLFPFCAVLHGFLDLGTAALFLQSN